MIARPPVHGHPHRRRRHIADGGGRGAHAIVRAAGWPSRCGPPVRARGRPATVQVSDRWRHRRGGRARVHGAARRRATALPCRWRSPPGQVRAAVRCARGGPGAIRVTVQGPVGATTSACSSCGPVARRLRVLATGDSMIQIIDGDLQRRLARRGPISVRSDAHISTGISKPFMFDWLAARARVRARASSRPHRDVPRRQRRLPDGHPVRGEGAVLRPGVGARVRPPRANDDALLRPPRRRNGLLAAAPRPRSQRFQAVFGPVNQALRTAAQSFPGIVHA